MTGMMSPSLPSASWELRDGVLFPDASVPLSDRGFRYGQHFFETLPVRLGQWHFYREHLQRLIKSAQEAGFPPLVAPSCALLTELPRLPEFEAWSSALVRLYWTAGDGAPSAPPAPGRFFVFAEAMEPESAPRVLRLIEDPGVCVVLRRELPFFSHQTNEIEANGGAWKTGNYWASLQALALARSAGADEALRFNAEDKLVGACLGNVFYRRNSAWWTPPLGDGPRDGVARSWLLAQGFAKEASLYREEAREITEWLICNSRLGPCLYKWVGGSPNEETSEVTCLWKRFHGSNL